MRRGRHSRELPHAACLLVSTSICAIVGGTFTTVGLIDAVAHKVLKAGKQL